MHSNLQFLTWVSLGLYLVAAAVFIGWLAMKARGARRKLGIAGLALLILGSLVSIGGGALFGVVGMAFVYALAALVDLVGLICLICALVAKASPAEVRA